MSGSRGRWAAHAVFGLAAACGCVHRPAELPPIVADPAGEPSVAAKSIPPAPSPRPPEGPTGHQSDRRNTFVAWLRERLPPGGEIAQDDDGGVRVIHTASEGDSATSLAKAYLDITDVYVADELAVEIGKANRHARLNTHAHPGDKIEIPHLRGEPYQVGDAARLGWPADGVIRGIYLRGNTAGGPSYVRILEHLADRDMNAVVIDTKDTDGYLTYRSRVPLAVETGATKSAVIHDLARAIRFAHERGIRVIMRISCFHDEWVQPRRKDLSVKGKWGGSYPIGWLDPLSEGAHQYVIDLAKEAMDAGADEIQLDYVRYPVIGTKNADFHLTEHNLTRIEVIRDFVREVHAVTKARGVPLSLDVFGVIALGKRVDIDALGQDLALLGPECEALSPMVYPSHYAKGFMGFDEPGNHPELVAVGTKGTLEQLAAAKVSGTVVRPWLQAFYWESPDYGPQYLLEETRHAEAAGGTGWLMWNPGQDYSYAWQVIPKKKKKQEPTAAR
jgi:hypothetical protein